MDDADIASERSEQILAAQIAAVRARQQTAAPENCIDCDEPNLPQRRALGLPRCYECAAYRERVGR